MNPTNQHFDVVVVGSFNTDLSFRSARMPVPGETILGRQFRMGPGGKGANQAVAAARLGAKVAFIGMVGDDPFGELALQTLTEEGLDVRYVGRTREAATGAAAIHVDDTGQNMIVVAAGANHLLTKEHIQQANEVITQSKVVVAQMEVPDAAIWEALQMGHQAGAVTILNPAPAHPLPDKVYPYIDILTPNETEAGTLAGMQVTNRDTATKAAEHLRAKGTPTTVVTMGAAGALLCQAEGASLHPTKAVQVVDSTGAGDAFNGALAVALASGKPMEQAIAFANSAAALAVTREGTTPAMPYLREVAHICK